MLDQVVLVEREEKSVMASLTHRKICVGLEGRFWSLAFGVCFHIVFIKFDFWDLWFNQLVYEKLGSLWSNVDTWLYVAHIYFDFLQINPKTYQLTSQNGNFLRPSCEKVEYTINISESQVAETFGEKMVRDESLLLINCKFFAVQRGWDSFWGYFCGLFYLNRKTTKAHFSANPALWN